MKRIGWIALGVGIAFGAGWLAGSSGRSAAEVTAGRAEVRAEFLEARALILQGRIRVFELNFGDAAQQFEAAGHVVERLQTRLRETGLAERAGLLEVALSYLREAGAQAAALDPGAQGTAGDALRTLERVGGPPSAAQR